MAAGTNNNPSRLSSLSRRTAYSFRGHLLTRLKTLPQKMIRPTMNGKVPASTPAADQPMPLSRLETTTAAPNAPVSSAVAVSRLRREIIALVLSGNQPALLGGNLVGALDILLDEFVEGVTGKKRIGLRGLLDVFLPFRRALDLLHQIHIEGGLLRGDLSGQPDRARLLKLRNVEAGFDAGWNIMPVLGLRDLRSIGKPLRAEGAQRTLGAAFPLPDTFARIVDMGVDMAAGQLHRGLGAALERNVGELQVGCLVDQPRQRFIGIL